jgi:hypothetical protein
MKIINRTTSFQALSTLGRSNADKNRRDASSQIDLTVALRRIKNRNQINMREAEALMKNGYNVSWKGEEEGVVRIDGKNYNFKLYFDSLESNSQ